MDVFRDTKYAGLTLAQHGLLETRNSCASESRKHVIVPLAIKTKHFAWTKILDVFAAAFWAYFNPLGFFFLLLDLEYV